MLKTDQILECPKEIYVGISGLKWENNPLAYVTYKKSNNKIAKEVSFNNWCSEKSERKTFENTPQKGFKVLFTVGGCKSGWNVRQTYFRVVDPRGFEFEIVADNFVDILQDSVINKGVIEGEFAYGWLGAGLVLLNGNDPRYIEATKAKDTELSSQKITKDNIQIGMAYRLRNHKEGYYLGKLMWHGYNEGSKPHNDYEHYYHVENPMHTFICKNEEYDKGENKFVFVGYKEYKNIKFALDKTISEDKVNECIELFKNTSRGSKLDNIVFPLDKKDPWSKKNYPERFEEYSKWVTTPYVNEDTYHDTSKYKFQYCSRRFFFEGDNRLDTIISFKFKDGTIKNFLHQTIILTDDKEHLIEDGQVERVEISEHEYYGKPKYYYNDSTTWVSHFCYECFYVHGTPEWNGDTTKLRPIGANQYLGSYEWETKTKNGKYSIPLNVGKTYETVKLRKGLLNL